MQCARLLLWSRDLIGLTDDAHSLLPRPSDRASHMDNPGDPRGLGPRVQPYGVSSSWPRCRYSSPSCCFLRSVSSNVGWAHADCWRSSSSTWRSSRRWRRRRCAWAASVERGSKPGAEAAGHDHPDSERRRLRSAPRAAWMGVARDSRARAAGADAHGRDHRLRSAGNRGTRGVARGCVGDRAPAGLRLLHPEGHGAAHVHGDLAARPPRFSGHVVGDGRRTSTSCWGNTFVRSCSCL